MARRSGAAVVLGSATPSIEALFTCSQDPAWHHVVLPERANGRPLPAIQVVDMAKEFGGGSRSMFSHALVCACLLYTSASHIPRQMPQRVQASASIDGRPSSSNEMASAGQASAQREHEMCIRDR